MHPLLTRATLTSVALLIAAAALSGCEQGAKSEQADDKGHAVAGEQSATVDPTEIRAEDDYFEDRRLSVTEQDRVSVDSMQGELAQDFRTVGELGASSGVVAVVVIQESRDEPFSNIPFTVSTVKVLEGIKGAEGGATLTIVETGGTYAGRSKDPSAPPAERREVGFEGIPVMKPGETWLVFLTGPTHVGPVPDGAHGVLGVFQGKFRVGTDGRIAFMGEPDEIDSPWFATQRELRGLQIDTVVAGLKGGS